MYHTQTDAEQPFRHKQSLVSHERGCEERRRVKTEERGEMKGEEMYLHPASPVCDCHEMEIDGTEIKDEQFEIKEEQFDADQSEMPEMPHYDDGGDNDVEVRDQSGNLINPNVVPSSHTREILPSFPAPFSSADSGTPVATCNCGNPVVSCDDPHYDDVAVALLWNAVLSDHNYASTTGLPEGKTFFASVSQNPAYVDAGSQTVMDHLGDGSTETEVVVESPTSMASSTVLASTLTSTVASNSTPVLRSLLASKSSSGSVPTTTVSHPGYRSTDTVVGYPGQGRRVDETEQLLPYKCGYCHVMFSSAKHLRSHHFKSHPEYWVRNKTTTKNSHPDRLKPFGINCGRLEKNHRANKVVVHDHPVTQFFPFVCSVCHLRFQKLEHVQYHTKTYHPSVTPLDIVVRPESVDVQTASQPPPSASTAGLLKPLNQHHQKHQQQQQHQLQQQHQHKHQQQQQHQQQEKKQDQMDVVTGQLSAGSVGLPKSTSPLLPKSTSVLAPNSALSPKSTSTSTASRPALALNSTPELSALLSKLPSMSSTSASPSKLTCVLPSTSSISPSVQGDTDKTDEADKTSVSSAKEDVSVAKGDVGVAKGDVSVAKGDVSNQVKPFGVCSSLKNQANKVHDHPDTQVFCFECSVFHGRFQKPEHVQFPSWPVGPLDLKI